MQVTGSKTERWACNRCLLIIMCKVGRKDCVEHRLVELIKHLLGNYNESSTILNNLHIIAYLMLITNAQGRHDIDEENKRQRS